jgi:hypothetical protein
MNAITVTPKLLMGPPEAAGAWPGIIPVESAGDAITAMRSGHTALLPSDSWELAGEVLRLCGADEDWIEFTLDRAGRGAAA